MSKAKSKRKRLPRQVHPPEYATSSLTGGRVEREDEQKNALALIDDLLLRLEETGGVVETYDDDVIEPLRDWWERCGRAERARGKADGRDSREEDDDE